MALPMILLTTSQILIGRTPGLLSKGMRRQAVNAMMVDGSIYDVHKRRAKAATAVQSEFDAP